MASDFLTWCERRMRQKLAATMELVWDWVSRQISLLPRWVSSGLHGNQEVGAQDPGVLSRVQERVTLAQLSTPSSASVTTPTHYPMYWCSWLQNLWKPVHRETKAENSTERWAMHVSSSSAASWVTVCCDHGWRMGTYVLHSRILLCFSWKFLRRLWCFSKQFDQSRVWCLLFLANQ